MNTTLSTTNLLVWVPSWTPGSSSYDDDDDGDGDDAEEHDGDDDGDPSSKKGSADKRGGEANWDHNYDCFLLFLLLSITIP